MSLILLGDSTWRYIFCPVNISGGGAQRHTFPGNSMPIHASTCLYLYLHVLHTYMWLCSCLVIFDQFIYLYIHIFIYTCLYTCIYIYIHTCITIVDDWGTASRCWIYVFPRLKRQTLASGSPRDRSPSVREELALSTWCQMEFVDLVACSKAGLYDSWLVGVVGQSACIYTCIYIYTYMHTHIIYANLC